MTKRGKMTKILSVKARQILDSRGIPTIETEVKTNKGISTASAPSGKSKGINEALELRDQSKEYKGMSVHNAIKNINTTIARKLKGTKPENADTILLKLDSTPKKTRLGANTILSTSIACCKAAAQAQNKPLYSYIASLFRTKKMLMPTPAFNVINGGKHAGNDLDIQEYMILPTGAKTFEEALKIGTEIYQELKEIILIDYGKNATNIGDEGGFAPPLDCYEAPLDLIMDAVKSTGYFKKIRLGIDVAATSFYKNGKYYLEGTPLDVQALIQKYKETCNAYPITSIEDPFEENDFEAFSQLKKTLPKTQIVGDDILCTNPQRIQKAILADSCNCLLLKVNQIGTVTEALEAARIAIMQGWNVMVSHRSGETNDDFIADLAVGIGCGQIKAGAPCRGERLAKYNRLLKIEQESKIKYRGKIA